MNEMQMINTLREALNIMIPNIEDGGGLSNLNEKGLTEYQLAKLKMTWYNKLDVAIKKDEESCSICFNGYEGEDMVRVLCCNHFFHKHCVDIWLDKNIKCPICKKNQN